MKAGDKVAVEMEQITFIFDTSTRRPACVLLQALYGGDRRVCWWFRDWEVNPTASMVKITGTEEQIKALAEECKISELKQPVKHPLLRQHHEMKKWRLFHHARLKLLYCGIGIEVKEASRLAKIMVWTHGRRRRIWGAARKKPN